MTQMTKNTTTLFVVLGVLALAVLAFLLYPKTTVAPTESPIATTTPEGATEGSEPKTSQVTGKTKVLPAGTSGSAPAIALSKVLLKSASSVSLYSGVDPSGRVLYKPVPGVDISTFIALTELDAIEHPTVKNGTLVTSLGVGSVAYYKDKNRVYVLSVFENNLSTQTAIEVVQDADPASFSVQKSAWYAVDKAHVFRLEAPTGSASHSPGTYEWQPYDLRFITNADASTFAVVSDVSLKYDAHDKSHTYRKGVEVGVYP